MKIVSALEENHEVCLVFRRLNNSTDVPDLVYSLALLVLERVNVVCRHYVNSVLLKIWLA